MKLGGILSIALFLFGLIVSAHGQLGQITPSGILFPGQTSCSQATTLNAKLSGQNTSAVTTAVCGMVSDGVWSTLDALWVFAINSTGNSLLNWVSTSFSLTKNGTCTFTANAGYTGDGSSCYFATGFTPSSGGTNYTQNSATVGFCDYTANSESTAVQFGGQGSSSNQTFLKINTTTFAVRINDATTQNITVTNSKGSWGMTRVNSSGGQAYLNGINTTSLTIASTGLPNGAQTIMAYNNNGTVGNFSTDELGYIYVGGAQNGTLAASIYNRMHSYLSSVGAPSGC